MGHYSGSGGRNKTHGSTAQYARISSDTASQMLKLTEDNDRDTWTHERPGLKLTITADCMEWNGMAVKLDYIPCGFGSRPRVLFFCPHCGKRFRYLYEIPYRGKTYPLCRECANLNYPSQQCAHGWKEACSRTFEQLRKMGHDVSGLSSADAEEITPERPKGQHMRTYHKNLIKLRNLQNEQAEAELRRFATVFAILDYKRV